MRTSCDSFIQFFSTLSLINCVQLISCTTQLWIHCSLGTLFTLSMSTKTKLSTSTEFHLVTHAHLLTSEVTSFCITTRYIGLVSLILLGWKLCASYVTVLHAIRSCLLALIVCHPYISHSIFSYLYYSLDLALKSWDGRAPNVYCYCSKSPMILL